MVTTASVFGSPCLSRRARLEGTFVCNSPARLHCGSVPLQPETDCDHIREMTHLRRSPSLSCVAVPGFRLDGNALRRGILSPVWCWGRAVSCHLPPSSTATCPILIWGRATVMMGFRGTCWDEGFGIGPGIWSWLGPLTVNFSEPPLIFV